MTSYAQRIAAAKAATETPSANVVSLPTTTTAQKPQLRIFVSAYPGFNYRFKNGKLVVFKAYAGSYKYYATAEEAEELRTADPTFVSEQA